VLEAEPVVPAAVVRSLSVPRDLREARAQGAGREACAARAVREYLR
jgi:hypothetical protein